VGKRGNGGWNEEACVQYHFVQQTWLRWKECSGALAEEVGHAELSVDCGEMVRDRH
jgi:hypothetical protein